MASPMKPEEQATEKAKLKTNYKEARAKARTKGQPFNYTLKTWAEQLRYEWDGPPPPGSTIPNFKFKVYDADDVSSDDGFDSPPSSTLASARRSSEVVKVAGKKRACEQLSNPDTSAETSDMNNLTAAVESTDNAPKTAETLSNGRKIPGSIQRGTFLNQIVPAKSNSSSVPSPIPNTAGAGAFTTSKPTPSPIVIRPAKPTLSHDGASATVADKAWGKNIPWLPERRSRRNDVINRDLHAKFFALKELIAKSKNPRRAAELGEMFSRIRSNLHQFRHYKPDEATIDAAGILNASSGLPALFLPKDAAHHYYPFDIRADSEELANRWRRRDFNPDILRDVEFKGSKHGRLREDRVKIRADSAGDGDLVNGQWFANWLCALRDGAHGSAQAGIYGKVGQGAFSIVMAGQYDDIDNGDEIEYCGVIGVAVSSSDANGTAHLRSNLGRSDRPVRVIRSAGMKNSKYKPELGLRYDGLYKITGEKVLDATKREYTFYMERCAGQDPIRWEGAARRPTEEEVDNFRRHKNLLSSIN